MSVHQTDKWGDTAIFYAVEAKKLETIVYLLKKGASLGVHNQELQSPATIASVEVTRELQARVEEWGEPLNAPPAQAKKDRSPKGKRKRVEEEGSAAEGP